MYFAPGPMFSVTQLLAFLIHSGFHLIYFCSSTLSSATGKGAGAPVMASTGQLSPGYVSRHLLMFAGLVLKPRGPNISLLANSTLKLDQKGPKGEPCLALHESCASPGLAE